MPASCRPLRIALANETDGPGGVEVLLVQLAEELAERGHTVIPILPLEREHWLHEAFRARGFFPRSVRFQGFMGRKALVDLRSILREEGVEVLHSHEFAMAVFGTAAAGALGIPHVISMHGNQEMTRALRRRVALRWAFRNSTAAVAVSVDTRRHLEDTLGLSPGVLRTIPNGIPIRTGDPEPVRREFGLADDGVMLLSVGNLSERKGHAILLKALAAVRAQGIESGWHLVIAGRGSQRPVLESLTSDLGLEGRVTLAGHRDDIPALQAAADLFVMPSLWEGLPLAVLEAMFAGTPVVASRTSGIPEAIEDGIDGVLVPPGEVDALAQALAGLLENAGRREALGSAGRTRALREFTVQRMASDYEALYRSSPSTSPTRRSHSGAG